MGSCLCVETLVHFVILLFCKFLYTTLKCGTLYSCVDKKSCVLVTGLLCITLMFFAFMLIMSAIGKLVQKFWEIVSSFRFEEGVYVIELYSFLEVSNWWAVMTGFFLVNIFFKKAYIFFLQLSLNMFLLVTKVIVMNVFEDGWRMLCFCLYVG